MENPKQQLIDRLKAASNVLITVSKDPSVDQLSAAIGLTLMLNRLDKHATAVFSGQTPSTIEFLEPEKTLEKNTDSLRDFIIALDKSKADKLRYKVEENQVRIFITPYKTSISEADLDFSQGDFNVEVVVALGVIDQKELDQAISSHGRILHDATVASLTTTEQSSLGTLNWQEPSTSSLCEMVASLAAPLELKELDGQVATALMTGIVAETERFSNQKTSPQTMSVSAALMAAGANQQLVASKLNEPEPAPQTEAVAADSESLVAEDGSLKIEHGPDTDESTEPELDLPELPEFDDEEPAEESVEQIAIDENGDVDAQDEQPEPAPTVEPEEPTEPEAVAPAAEEPTQPEPEAPATESAVLEPPQLGGQLTANTEPEALDPATDVLGNAAPADDEDAPKVLLHHAMPKESPKLDLDDLADMPAPSMDLPSEQPIQSAAEPAPAPLETPLAGPVQTLSDLEAAVRAEEASPPAPEAPSADAPDPLATLDTARDAVTDALASITDDSPLPPIDALNAQPLGPDLQTGVNGILSDEEAAAPAPAAPTEPPAVPPPFMPNLPGFDPNAFEDISDPTAPTNP